MDDQRYRLGVDWNLRSCGRQGHITYAPDEPALREPLHVATSVGVAWRCLRCGDFVIGEPKASGPAASAPEVRRGKQLRDLVILRLLALERLFRGALVLLAAYAVFTFSGHQGTVQKAFDDDLPAVQNLAEKFNWNVANSSFIVDIQKLFTVNKGTLTLVAIGLAVYGLLQLTEATGLWLLKRWGEYFAAVATAAFIPLEVYEATEKLTWLRIGAFIINVGAVVYLIVTKRLFGVRGGVKAYEAERHEERILEIETAAEDVKLRHPAEPQAAVPASP